MAIVALAFGAAAAFDGLALLLALGLGTAVFAVTTERQVPTERPRFCLEHRLSGRVRILAATSDEASGRATLQLQAEALTAAGARGQLVLVDVITGQLVIWQVLAQRTADHSAV